MILVLCARVSGHVFIHRLKDLNSLLDPMAKRSLKGQGGLNH